MIKLFYVHFFYPYFFLLSPIPWILQKIIPRVKTKVTPKAIYAPSLVYLSNQVLKPQKNEHSYNPILFRSFGIFWIMLLVLAAQPYYIDIKDQSTQANCSLIALDISQSMQIDDIKSLTKRQSQTLTTRLNAAKNIIHKLVYKYNHKFMLMVFSETAHIITPLTEDYDTLLQVLKPLEIGITGEKTALGDAIVHAINSLNNITEQCPYKNLIIFTDGENTTGSIPLVYSAKIAQKNNIIVHVINLDSQKNELDYKKLQLLTTNTNGKYINADNDYKNINLPFKNIVSTTKEKLNQPFNVTYIYIILFIILTLNLLIWMHTNKSAKDYYNA